MSLKFCIWDWDLQATTTAESLKPLHTAIETLLNPSTKPTVPFHNLPNLPNISISNMTERRCSPQIKILSNSSHASYLPLHQTRTFLASSQAHSDSTYISSQETALAKSQPLVDQSLATHTAWIDQRFQLPKNETTNRYFPERDEINDAPLFMIPTPRLQWRATPLLELLPAFFLSCTWKSISYVNENDRKASSPGMGAARSSNQWSRGAVLPYGRGDWKRTRQGGKICGLHNQ